MQGRRRNLLADRDPGAGDQLATSWSFVRAAADIHSIRIVPFRANNEPFGLAFDRFNACSSGLVPTPVPATGTAGRALLGLLLLGAVMRYRRSLRL